MRVTLLIDVSSKSASPNPYRLKGNKMLHYTVVFLVIALVAAVFGFTGIAAGAVGIAQILFYIFLLLFVISLVFGLMHQK
jgi:uncharacterized membrane protein YtjA (UPF0391 family)